MPIGGGGSQDVRPRGLLKRYGPADVDACTSGLEGLECPLGRPPLERPFFA
jgi:hypothetical protein